MPSDSEMMADLAAADAAGDHDLAQHIAGQIKAAGQPAPLSIGDRLKYAAHKTAGMLPAAGGIAGGVLGGTAGGALGFPTTGPGGIATTIGGASLGAGLLSAGGKSLQHAIDSALGYEENPGIAATAIDSAKTGAQDAAFTAAGGMALPTMAGAAGKLAPAVESIGNRFARRVLSGGATPLTVKKPISSEALDAAMDAGAFKPWGTTKRAAGVLDGAREETGNEYGRVVKALEEAGVTGPDIPKLAQEYMQRAASARSNTLNPAVADVFDSTAKQLQQQATVPYAPGQGPLALSQAENMKRSLQDMARSSYQKLDPAAVGQAKEEAASMLRKAVEESVTQQAGLAPEEAAAFEPVKNKLSRLIEASKAAEKGAAMADRRQGLSLTDILAGSSGVAHGGPLEGAGFAAMSKGARTFGPSAGAWAGKGMADALRKAAGLPVGVPSQVGAVTAAGAAESPGSLLQDLLDQIRQRRNQSLAVQ